MREHTPKLLVTVLPVVWALWCAPVSARGADLLVEFAVTSLAQLTDPVRLASLPDNGAVAAQLGPALGWLHVARRHDVAPEAVIARALERNGLTGERALATRESLLRNLARADAWELFNHADTAHALAYGRPPMIPTGMHRGQLARVSFAVLTGGVLQEAQRPPGGWDFGSLSLRADDEPPPRPLSGRRRSHPGEGANAVASAAAPRRPGSTVPKRERAHVPPPPIIYDEPLPTADP